MALKKREPIVWHTYEYVYREKSADWFWAVGIIAVSMSVTAVLFGNVLFAIFLVLAFLSLMLYARREPDLLEIKLDHRGLQEGRTHYPFSSLESFWVEDRFGEVKIIIQSKKKLMPYIVIPIEGVEGDTVRDHLRRFLPEEEHAEPLAKKIMEYLGF